MSSQPEEKIIDKLKKLLRLAASSNPHEAGLALARAMDLAEKHKVELAQLKGGDVEEYVKELFPHPAQDTDRWVYTLVSQYFHMRMVYTTDETGAPSLAYIGKESDIPFAQFVFEYLQLNFKLSWMTYKFQNKLKTDDRRDSFYQGLFMGVQEKLGIVRQEAIQCQEYAIVLQTEDQRLKAELLKFFPNLRAGHTQHIKTNNEKAREAGISVGKTIQISRPLDGKAGALRLGN